MLFFLGGSEVAVDHQLAVEIFETPPRGEALSND